MRNSKLHRAILLTLFTLLFALSSCSAPAQPDQPATEPEATEAAAEAPEEVAPEPTAVEATEAEATAEPAPTEEAAEEPTEAPAEEPAEEPPVEEAGEAPSGTITIGLPGDVNTLDRANSTTEFMNSISRHIQQSPLFQNPDGTVSPLLAESWEIIDDTHIRFHLRRDVSFSNGEPFNADVFQFSWDWIKAHEIRNREVWGLVEALDIEDEYTVTMTLTEPDPVALQKIANNFPMYPPVYTEEVGFDAFGEHPIGTGPFVFGEWIKGDRIVLEANPNYFEPGRPRVQTLIYRPIPEASTRAAALQAGDIDVARLLPVELVPQLEEAPGITVVAALGTRTYSILFNNMTSGVGTPIESREVRQALNLAVDREAIVDVVLEGYGEPLSSFIGPDMFGFDPTLPAIPYDPEQAMALLDEAGYPDGFEIGMACPAGAYVKVEQVCQAVAGYLEDIGITVDLDIMESGQFWDQVAAREITPLFFDGWGSRVLDPTTQLLGAFVPDSVADYGSEWANFYDPQYVEYFEAQGFTLDEEVRRDVLADFARYMQEEPAAIWLYQQFLFEGIRDRVHNYVLYPTETQLFYDVWVED